MNSSATSDAAGPSSSVTADGNLKAHAPGMPVVTVIGDGQLARMMQTAAIELGQSLRILASDPASSAAQVASDVLLGDYTDLADLRRAAAGASVVTFDHEHVPSGHLHALVADGVSVQPGPGALIHAQDKLVMRRRLREMGAPVPPFLAVDSVADAVAFADAVDGAVCLKARRGGYDGKGVWFPTPTELPTLVEQLLADGIPLMAEKRMDLVRELSALCARTPSGQTVAWPVVESVQRDGICWEAVCPAPGLDPGLAQRARQLGVAVAEELDVTGVLAVELFEVRDSAGQPDIVVNELAMRPHNTGHWTQDGSVTSQFEQHLRAVLDQPLGAVDQTSAATAMANVLGAVSAPEQPMGQRVAEVARRFPRAKVHLYGKGERPGRKLGHVNLCGADAGDAGVARLRREAQLAAGFLASGAWADGWVDGN